jgi:broad specificity phosphatase PhoE
MTLVRLVRHGHAAAGFGDDHDPGLDDLGRGQAAAMAAALDRVGPLPVVVSPLRRTRQTAAALEEIWGVTATVDERVAEIPTPTDDLGARAAWLSQAMAGTWTELGADHVAWRDALVAAVLALSTDTVVVTHFIAINAIVGCAVGDDRVMHAPIDNCSVTTIDTAGGISGCGLVVVELGRTAVTEVR